MLCCMPNWPGNGKNEILTSGGTVICDGQLSTKEGQ